MSIDAHIDYYRVLGVDPGASKKEIDQAYKQLAARYHPDKHQQNELRELAEEKLAALNEAHWVLTDSTRRAAYDRARRNVGAASSPPGAPYCAPRTPSPVAGKTIGRLLFAVGLLLAMPFLLRIVRSPRAALVVGAAIALAYFGPRLFKKK